ncbi:MAG TPA: hypothetical protein VGB98_08700, partial [Pyrinomonadaceae bacterium]
VIPLSFNVGINDHLELFFSTEGWRGVKVNNPKHLSSFYLPNSQLFFGQTLLGSGPAVILAPTRVSGSTLLTTNSTLFRPAFNQPFVQFPFVGGTGLNFGLTGNNIAVAFTSTLGPVTGTEQGNFGSASNFGGIGSPCGSILPGVVLTTRTIPANLTFQTLTVPDLFTICPTYVADAPFVNRLYGESSFGTMQAGAKIRFTGPNNPLGVGLVAFYRWYLDKADDFSGFNQRQRGASPGGDIGDFGLVGFVSGRLSRSVSLHANFGYILNSNPQSEAFGTGKVTLLDRPDEVVAGVGMDFVVNKHFQLITELKSVHYAGGKTPNAFPNNPVEWLGGVRIFPRRWFGFSAAYRGHLNQQGKTFTDIFGDEEPNHGFPAGFRTSDDPHGFIFQFFAGRRNERTQGPVNCTPEIVSITKPEVVLPCPPGYQTGSCPAVLNRRVQLTAEARDQDNDTLLYTWKTTVGTFVATEGGGEPGTGPTVTLELPADVAEGSYDVTVTVDDGCAPNGAETKTTKVHVKKCPYCYLCPKVTVSCPDEVDEGTSIRFRATVTDGDPKVTPTYNWTVSAGTITSGQGTDSIEVDTTGLGDQTVTATATVVGYAAACPPATGECRTKVNRTINPIYCRAFDAYEDITFNNEKARLDLFAIRLKEDRQAKGYYVTYGGRGRGVKSVDAAARAERAQNYLYEQRGIDKSRVIIVDRGPAPDCFKVILWVCPSGAGTPPTDLGNEQVQEALRTFDVQCPPEGSYTPRQPGPKKKVRKRHVRRQGGGS